ncbi:MAG: hypothetical protein KDE56_07505 [Anaerolineales bacterium]|nr:hypothetical protein [Anaerolineales bacterium]
MFLRRKISWMLLVVMLLTAVSTLTHAQPIVHNPGKWDLLVIDEDDTAATPESHQTTLPGSQTAVSRHLSPDDAYTLVGQSAALMPTLRPSAAGDLILVSSSENGTVNGIDYKDEDILAYDTGTSEWQMVFDGSDVGISNDVNGFAFLRDGSLLLTFKFPTYIPGVGQVQNADMVRFIPTRWGDNTNGRFELFFDGSDVDLAAPSEDIDAIAVLDDGRILISTRGSSRFGRRPYQLRGRDEDILAFTPTSLGSETAGSWRIYQSGELLGWVNDEDVQALWMDSANGELYASTDSHTFTILGSDGSRSETLVYAPGTVNANIQANANANNSSISSANSSAIGFFDGLDILR